MIRRRPRPRGPWPGALVLLLASAAALGEPHIAPGPDAYVLESDVELSGGRVVPAGTRWYEPPAIERLRRELEEGRYEGDVERARRIVLGHDIVRDTWATLGEGRTDGRPALGKGRIMNCDHCHAGGGVVPHAWPFFRTITYYGLAEEGAKGVYFGGLGYHRDARTRARDCVIDCGSLAITNDSPEMDALIAWLIAVRDGIYPGEGLLVPEFRTVRDVDRIPGATVPVFPGILDMKADPAAGGRVYRERCAGCHGADGAGQWGDRGYIYPPLAGAGSFSHAGGPLMIPIGAAFIHRNMPLSQPGSLTRQAALDVMAWVATLPRPDVWWQSYLYRHEPCERPPWLPLHVGEVPDGLPFDAAQVQFGPWRPVADWLGSEECRARNPPRAPALDREFDARDSR